MSDNVKTFPERFLTVKQIAGLLQLSYWTVLRLCRSGKLPAKKIGREWRMAYERLNQYMTELEKER